MKMTFMIVILIDSIGSQKFGNDAYSDQGSQTLKFDWVTIIINQLKNTMMLEGGRMNLVDNFILNIWIILPDNIEILTLCYLTKSKSFEFLSMQKNKILGQTSK